MSVVKKFMRQGYYVDVDVYKFRSRHKSRVLNDYLVSDYHSLIDKKHYLFHNDEVFIYDDQTDFEKSYGSSGKAQSFDGEYDDFKEFIYDDED